MNHLALYNEQHTALEYGVFFFEKKGENEEFCSSLHILYLCLILRHSEVFSLFFMILLSHLLC